jgi:hypothetical protein
MKPFPRIRLEPLDIEALDMRPAQNEIRARYGSGYHLSDACLQDVAALWGIGPEHACINRHGVFEPYQSLEWQAGRCRAEIDYVRSPSGLWATATGYQTANAGGSYAPSVWNAFAFQSETDARAAALHRLIERFRGMADQGMTDARRLVELLEDERTPQLSLF